MELLSNFHEEHKETKAFHYAWLLILIILVAWRLQEDIQLPLQGEELSEVANFTSLWVTKGMERITKSKVF